MLFWNKICGLTSTFFLCVLFTSAQSSYVKFSSREKPQMLSGRSLPITIQHSNTENIKAFKPLPVIPKDYYTQHFGIMCKKELALEKLTKIPFRFRLGSLQQCNYLEGKK